MLKKDKMFSLANRLRSIQPSPTLALNARAAALKAEGVNIINLAAGEPDFETPEWIQEAAVQAMRQGLTKYTAVDGLSSLKKAIQRKFLRDNQLAYELQEITVANGGKQILFNAMMATLNPGDEVIIPSPYWVSYPDIVRMFEGVDRMVPCGEESHFKLTPALLEKALTSHTKWLILNSPSNPTGAVYTVQELKDLAEVLRQHPDVWILSDDIYEHLVYDQASFTNIIQVDASLKSRTLILNGVSKSYSMTGWRIGYGAGPERLIKAMNLIQSQSTSNACSIAQGAAIEALNGPQGFLKEWQKVFAERRDITLKALNRIEGLHGIRPGGAFYLYINCGGVLGRKTPSGQILETDNQFCQYLLESARVTVVSGDAFGLSPYFRLSYATSLPLLEEACCRIGQAVSQLESGDHGV